MSAAFRQVLAAARAEQPPADDAPAVEHWRYLNARLLVALLSPPFLLLWLAATVAAAAWEVFW